MFTCIFNCAPPTLYQSFLHSFIGAAAVTNDYCIALKKVTGRKKECRL